MSGLGKTRAGWEAGSVTERRFGADMLIECDDGWPVAYSPEIVYQYNGAPPAFRFPADKECGAGYYLRIPENTTIMQVRLMSAVDSDEDTSVSTRLYFKPRGRSWEGPRALGLIRFEGRNLQDYTSHLLLKHLKLNPEDYVRFEVTRNPHGKGDAHEGFWILHWIGVNFA